MIEPFKGKALKDRELDYISVIEHSDGDREERFLGDKVIFLLKRKYATREEPTYAALENSTLDYTDDLGKKLKIVRAAGKKSKLK